MEGTSLFDLPEVHERLLRERSGEFLDGWLDQVKQSKIPELHSFAT